jgi:geranylgeranyl diphosphate synthase type I
MSGTTEMPAVLGRARDAVAPALRAALGTLSAELRPAAAYHHGFADADGRPTGGDGGKGFRPALVLLSAEAAGGTVAAGVPGAVAIELVHNFSLIHDDVIDEDAERRHRPTVWTLFGIGAAVIVGDALLALAQQVVLDPARILGESQLPADPSAAARRIADATAAMIAGQALDMAFESEDEVSVERCLAMESGKTGALLGCAPSETVAALDRFGSELGLAYQAVDDLLGIWGDPETTGKPTYSDLRQHKKSLPISAALENGGPRAAELAELLRHPLDDAGLVDAANLVEELGGRAAAGEQAKLRLESALAALGGVRLAPGPAAELAELADFVVERQF